ncbi:MAG: hypothetical protein ACREH8_18135 [Opitutaceae bacterium]
MSKSKSKKARQKKVRAFSILAAETPAPRSVKTFEIAVAKTPLVVSWEVIVEGQHFLPPDFKLEGGKWVRSFVDYPVSGDLDVHLNASGVDDGNQVGKAAGRISQLGKAIAPDLYVETTKGYGTDYEKYTLA